MLITVIKKFLWRWHRTLDAEHWKLNAYIMSPPTFPAAGAATDARRYWGSRELGSRERETGEETGRRHLIKLDVLYYGEP